MHESWGNEGADAARFEPRCMKPGARCRSGACASPVVPGAEAKSMPGRKRMSCAHAEGSISTTSTPTTGTTIPKSPPPRRHPPPPPPPPPWLAQYHHKFSTTMDHGPRVKLRRVISHLWIRGYLKHRHGRTTRKVVLNVLRRKGPCLVRGDAAVVPESTSPGSDTSWTSRSSNSEWSATP